MKEKYLFPEALYINVDANIITATVDVPEEERPDLGDGGDI